ncbi:protein of unknown function [bacterium A37T11]|nr:protein of unknown function [bacterium A37T11]
MILKKKSSPILVLWLALITAACNGQDKGVSIEVKNTLNFDRKELISIPYDQFKKEYKLATPFKIIEMVSGNEVPYQLEKAGKESIQNLLVQVAVPAKGGVVLSVKEGNPAQFAPKTYARYVPERMDDFAWENDLIAFRTYGKALEGQDGDANGFDIWAKRTDSLVVNKWYKSGDYHRDHGQGMDYYDVGLTLGAGDMAPVVADSIIYSKHYRTHEVLDNGPLRSTFVLGFEPWLVDGKLVSATKTIQIDAGSQLHKVSVDYDIAGGGSLQAAIGVSRRKDEGALLKEPEQGIFGYWEPAHGEDGILGIGVVSIKPFSSIDDTPKQYLAHVEVKHNEPFVYYRGGAWNKAGKITSAEAWFNYLKQYKAALDAPLKVTIK